MASSFSAAEIVRALARLRADARGGVAILFAALGGAVDLGRAYSARQKLAEVATLACQYAGRPSVVASVAAGDGFPDSRAYAAKVTGFIATSLKAQNFQYPQTTVRPFAYAPGGPADVALSASVPTSFMQVARVAQLPVSAATHCFDQPPAVAAGAAVAGLLGQGGGSEPMADQASVEQEAIQLAQKFCQSPPGESRLEDLLPGVSEAQLRALCPPR